MTSGLFREAFQETSRHPFRGMHTSLSEAEGKQVPGQYDAHLGYLFGNFLVERWREALLWSWVVGRVGGSGTQEGFFEEADSAADQEDEFDEDGNPIFDAWSRRSDDGRDNEDEEDGWEEDLHGRRAWLELGGEETCPTLDVPLSRRDALDFRRVDATLGRPAGCGPVGTAYTFCEWFDSSVLADPSNLISSNHYCAFDPDLINSEPGWLSIRLFAPHEVQPASTVDAPHALAALALGGSV